MPNYFVDIKNTIDFKLHAIKSYKSELKNIHILDQLKELKI